MKIKTWVSKSEVGGRSETRETVAGCQIGGCLVTVGVGGWDDAAALRKLEATLFAAAGFTHAALLEAEAEAAAAAEIVAGAAFASVDMPRCGLVCAWGAMCGLTRGHDGECAEHGS